MKEIFVLSQSWNSNRIVFHRRENIYTFFTDHCSLEDVLTNFLLGLFSLLLGEVKYSNIPPGKKQNPAPPSWNDKNDGNNNSDNNKNNQPTNKQQP